MTPKLTKMVWVVYCATCRIEMAGEVWPSHYRTKHHREALREYLRALA